MKIIFVNDQKGSWDFLNGFYRYFKNTYKKVDLVYLDISMPENFEHFKTNILFDYCFIRTEFMLSSVKHLSKNIIIVENGLYPVSDEAEYCSIITNPEIYNNFLFPKNGSRHRWNEISKEKRLNKVIRWRSRGENILYCLDSAENFNIDNLVVSIKNIRKHSNRHIKVRPHRTLNKAVVANICKRFKNVSLSLKEDLYEDLKEAHCCITKGSSAATKAALFGIPIIIIQDKIYLSEISQEGLHKIECLDYDIKTYDWLTSLGNAVFTMEQIESGEVWKLITQ